MYSASNCKRCNRTLFGTAQPDTYHSTVTQHTNSHQNLNNIRPWHYRQFKDKCCCYFSPIYHTTCACIRSAASATIGCNSNRASVSCTNTLNRRGNNNSKRINSMRRHSHHTMTDSVGAGYLMPATQAPHTTVLPQQRASVNGKICTRCHPAFRQYSFADAHHDQIPEDNNMTKYSYAGEQTNLTFLFGVIWISQYYEQYRWMLYSIFSLFRWLFLSLSHTHSHMLCIFLIASVRALECIIHFHKIITA